MRQGQDVASLALVFQARAQDIKTRAQIEAIAYSCLQQTLDHNIIHQDSHDHRGTFVYGTNVP